ncbi:MAG: pantetheine-phosphate adenylyltransferase [Clostridia bacterium]|nr:pantetheine-phosphate adenylyltransferase [Clostridia bacterium]
MKIGVYPGSFDPVTNGHIDIIKRSTKIFDKLIVGVINNPNKSPLFTMEERIDMISKSVKQQNLKDIEVKGFDGLLVDFMRQNNANIIVKGLRAVSDFEYEFQMALMNRKLDNEIETIFMMTSKEYSYLSSSMIKEVGSLNGCIKGLVPDVVLKTILNKLR